MNRRIKEKQIFMHKVHLMVWVAYGNQINRKLNNAVLMQMCLNLLPSKDSYPKGKVCLKYLESISKWYQGKIELKSRETYSDFKPLPPITTSLALQIKNLGALCVRDYTYIFVTLLRAMGIQCRLVINIPIIPIRPPQSALYKIPVKSTTESKKHEEPLVKKKKIEVESTKGAINKSQSHSKSTTHKTGSHSKSFPKPSTSTSHPKSERAASAEKSPTKTRSGTLKEKLDKNTKPDKSKVHSISHTERGKNDTSSNKTLASKLKEKTDTKHDKDKSNKSESPDKKRASKTNQTSPPKKLKLANGTAHALNVIPETSESDNERSKSNTNHNLRKESNALSKETGEKRKVRVLKVSSGS